MTPTGISSRAKTNLGVSIILLTLGCLLASLFPVAAHAKVKNSGTVKVFGTSLDKDKDDPNDPNNDPHVPCVFEIQAFGYTADPDTDDLTAAYALYSWPPTGSGALLTSGTFTVDGNDGGGNELDGSSGSLNLSPLLASIEPQANQGYHVKVEVEVDADKNAKHKVFWVDGCGATLNINKVTDPAGDNAEFDFTVTDDGGASQSVDNLTGPGPAGSFPVVTGKTYSVTEADPGANWSLSSASCDDGVAWTDNGTLSGRTISGIEVAANATINCTFTNTKATAPPSTWSISGTKTEDTDRNGIASGDNPKSNWTIKLVADANGNGVFDGGETVTTTTTNGSGDYSFTGLTDGADYLVCEADGGTGWTQLGPTSGATCTATGNATNGHNFQDLSADHTDKDFWNQPPAQTQTFVPGPPSTPTPTATPTPTPTPSATSDPAQPAEADLEVTKDVSPATASVGQNITYTMTITNHGPSDAIAVIMTDTLPAGMVFVSASGPCTGTTTVTCVIPILPAGATEVITVVAFATNAGTYTNGVAVESTTFDPDLSNNQDEVDSKVIEDEVLGGTTDPAGPGNGPAVRGGRALPFTGSEPGLLLRMSSLLLLSGSGLLMIGRRRRGRHRVARR